MNNFININNDKNSIIVANLQEKVKDYARHAFAKNTIKNYQSDWKIFCTWCESLNINPLNITHNTLIAYITFLAEENYKASTIQRKISAIYKYCETKNIHINLQDKEFKIVWQGIRRKIGIVKQGKDPILLKDLEDILQHISKNTHMGIRDRALLTFGWFSAMRRSELVKLNWQDISFIKEGIIINIRQSKTDKFGEGQKIAILKRKIFCPIKHLKAWQKINNNEAVFCSVNKADKVTGIRLSCIDVARITKKHSAKIDFDTSKIAGHSLRRGFVTTAVSSGIRNHIIMKTTRHKSSKMIDDYTHDNSLLENNATNMIITSNSSSKKFNSILKNYLQFKAAYKLYNKVKTNIKKLYFFCIPPTL
ncbi:site-specific integrase [Candidatus Aquarickettsia rohweri]|uniref:Integrase n=1 Tax=Candidatus Aquarickettsia rohweri TaxID=2602574 RepID=A0A3R9ZEY6_9RICK|nr:site-specific integrase [Candidatus Aquarickettsia rohweri]RST63805.1 hypothetical protein EIC27_05165 [Candidatus Aquarickettsia rohweri]